MFKRFERQDPKERQFGFFHALGAPTIPKLH